MLSREPPRFTGRTGGAGGENAFLFLEDQNQKYFPRGSRRVELAMAPQTRWRQRHPKNSRLPHLPSSRPPCEKISIARGGLDAPQKFLRFRLRVGSPRCVQSLGAALGQYRKSASVCGC